MPSNRLAIILSVLLLFFFISTSEGFAQISAVQEKLRELQVKLIQVRVRALQEQIEEARQRRNLEVEEARQQAVALPPVGRSREEIAQSLQNQIVNLQEIVRSLEPRLIEEETERLERRIREINAEISSASGERLRELRAELQTILTDYARLQDRVREALETSIQHRRAVILQNQLNVLQERILFVPRTPTVAPVKPDPEAAVKVQIGVLQEQIDAIRVKILREQAKLIQEKIQTLQK